jgi:hypothetical protein
MDPGLVSQIIPDPDPDAALPLDLTLKLRRSGKHVSFLKRKESSRMIILDADSGTERISMDNFGQ